MDKYIGLQLPVLLFTLALTVVTSVLFGSAPAWQAVRLNLNEAMKQGGRSSGGGRHGLRRALVVAEFALALVLLAGGGMAIHSFWKLAHADLGFRKDHVLTFFLPVQPGRLNGPEQITSHYRQLLEKFAALPGVSAATAATGMPVYGPAERVPFSIAGQAFSDPASRPTAGLSMVTPGYFQTFGIRLDRGRTFTEQDRAGGALVAIVNQSFVKRYLSSVDPLSQQLVIEQVIPGSTAPGPPLEWQIVGVFQDVRNRGLRGEELPEIELPFWQSPSPWAVMAVRTGGDPASVSKSIAGAVRAIDPDVPMTEVETMDQIVEESIGAERFGATLFGSFSGVALLLAALGIYGVMAFAVAQRTHEIGVRMALGAGRSQVLELVLKEGMVLAFTGLVLGLGGALIVGRTMQNRLYGIGAIDPAALCSVAAVLLFSALLACYVPAWRATKVDPLVALREE
jgi:putative ABC transport system permease protein